MAINCNELLDVQVVEGMSNFIFANDKFFRRLSIWKGQRQRQQQQQQQQQKNALPQNCFEPRLKFIFNRLEDLKLLLILFTAFVVTFLGNYSVKTGILVFFFFFYFLTHNWFNNQF